MEDYGAVLNLSASHPTFVFSLLNIPAFDFSLSAPQIL